MYSSWRSVLEIVDDDVTFAEVHNRFRLLMTTRELRAQDVFRLARAFEDARRELDGDPTLDSHLTVEKHLQRRPEATR